MKTVKLTVLFLFFPLVFFAQTLTGLWIGSVSNDSTTIRKDQSFEIVLTQYKNKVYGYSRSTFIVNDTLFYIVKRVKGTIEDDVCEVKDDEIVSYNFKGRLDKGIKMTTSFHFDHGDSTWRMDGDWKTNKTKKYYSLSGKATLNQEKDISKSKIFPHLEELKLADDVAFYKEAKKMQEQVATTKSPVQNNKKGEIAKTEQSPKETKTTVAAEPEQPLEVVVKRPLVTKENTRVTTINNDNNVAVKPKSEPVAQAKPVPIQKAPPVIEEKTIVASPDVTRRDSVGFAQSKTKTPVQTVQPATDNKKQPAVKAEPVVVTKPVEQKSEPAIEPVRMETKKQVTVSVEPTREKLQNTSLFQEIKPGNVPAAATMVAERKTAATQVVNFKSDSLLLSLYDNGEVDGDTVSVLLNGEVIIAKQELKVSALKKTIYVPAGKDDSLTLVLYAENLGKYPPNTGLLIVHDGNDTYQIRFSADLQQNAAVIFKRKRN